MYMLHLMKDAINAGTQARPSIAQIAKVILKWCN